MEEMKSINDTQQQKELMEKMSKGQFTLRDMYKQFQSVMKLGPLDKVMGMIPGMPEYLIPQNGDDESTMRLRKFMYMMDSMSDAELDGKIDMHKKNDEKTEKRIRRIAAGSGTHPNEVKALLQAHKQFEGMVSKMGKAGLMGKGAQAKQRQMQEMMKKNPGAMMKQLQNNPQAMQMVSVLPRKYHVQLLDLRFSAMFNVTNGFFPTDATAFSEHGWDGWIPRWWVSSHGTWWKYARYGEFMYAL